MGAGHQRRTWEPGFEHHLGVHRLSTGGLWAEHVQTRRGRGSRAAGEHAKRTARNIYLALCSGFPTPLNFLRVLSTQDPETQQACGS